MTNKEIELDPTYFKKLADAGSNHYYREINITLETKEKDRGAADSFGTNFGYGHVEFGLISVSNGVVSHKRRGLNIGAGSTGLGSIGTQQAFLKTSSSKYDFRSVVEVSEA